MPRHITAIFFLLSFYCSAAEAQNSIYYYETQQGELYFSDSVEHEGYKDYHDPDAPPPKTVQTGREIDMAIDFYARQYAIDANLLRAIIKAESNFNPKAQSPKGAQGLMQIMPMTAKTLNLQDPFDPTQNIRAGAAYLQSMLKHFKGDLRLALAAYNAGPNTVRRYGGVPPYNETIHYIQAVLGYYKQLKSLS